MNCIICADKTSSKVIEEFVGKHSLLNHVGTFSDSVSIKNQLSKNQDIPLIFFDTDKSEIDIFNFFSTSDFKPNVIIISSGDQNALKAFDFNAVDYLIKPVTYSRFSKAVDKVLKYYTHKGPGNADSTEIFIKNGASLVKLRLNDIIYIEALENYVTLHTKAKNFTIHFTMKAIENNLFSEIFIRVHRSFIVNRSLIKAINENSLELFVGDTQKEIPVGSSFRDSLLGSINMMTR
jgi:DNA-binding LytR/AlgR family response regulator